LAVNSTEQKELARKQVVEALTGDPAVRMSIAESLGGRFADHHRTEARFERLMEQSYLRFAFARDVDFRSV
jgi:hypothetical protein